MKRLIVDMSSVLWQSLLAGKDQEFGKVVSHNGKDVHVNGWQFGYECAINHMVDVLKSLDMTPKDLILVVEGSMSKVRRRAIYPLYKDEREGRPNESYVEFNKLKEVLCETFLNLGAQVVTQAGVEADDSIAYLARNLQGEIIIRSNDGDMTTLLHNPNVSLYTHNGLTKENKYGPFSSRFVPVYKALVGDGDEYKGAKGFGPKAFLDLLVWAGDAGLAALEGMMKRRTLHDLTEDVAEFKPLQKVIDCAEHVYQSYDCALLHDEWVNTLRQPLVWRAGMVRDRSVVTDKRLTQWTQQARLITAENVSQALSFFKSKVAVSPIISLDLETATPEASDDWLSECGAERKVDVFGSKITGMGLTFGDNNQYTYYFSVNHADTNNAPLGCLRDVLVSIPPDVQVVIQNLSFELPILFEAFGVDLKSNGWHGFVPNAVDTKIMSNYVDENQSSGLKSLSKLYLNYEQETYAEVTTLDGVQYKMDELSAERVFSYGCDDTICTAALYNHFRVRLEIENTWNLLLEVETKPAYLTALAFATGTNFSLERMKSQEAKDKATYDAAWQVLREYLINNGWEGTQTPVYTEALTPANVKEITLITLGQELETRVRTISKMAKVIAEIEHDDAELVADLIEREDLAGINSLVASRFDGEPVFDLNSPKQMKSFLYTTLGLPVRLANTCTPLERQNKPELAKALQRHRAIMSGSEREAPLTPSEIELIKTKARADDTAMDFALRFDAEGNKVLEAIKAMKVCDTRSKMFYRPYSNIRHWRDNKVHAQINQCATVTRRWTSSFPNLQQLPKGQGATFRECFVPHHKDAVIISCDFASQELRLQAGLSGDVEMLACYLGDSPKDMHSLTASGAMDVVWTPDFLARARAAVDAVDNYEAFMLMLECDDKEVKGKAKDLRKLAKGCNFGSAYGCQAAKMQELLVTDLQTATDILEAKLEKFNGYEKWKAKVEADAMDKGYVATELGGRRHLRDAMLSGDKWEAASAARQASNFKIQSAGAELAKRAMSAMWDSGVFFNYDAQFMAVIHDEVVFSVHKDQAVEVTRIVHGCMEQDYVPGFPVHFTSSISVGPDFGRQEELGEVVDAEVMTKAISNIFNHTV